MSTNTPRSRQHARRSHVSGLDFESHMRNQARRMARTEDTILYRICRSGSKARVQR